MKDFSLRFSFKILNYQKKDKRCQSMTLLFSYDLRVNFHFSFFTELKECSQTLVVFLKPLIALWVHP